MGIYPFQSTTMMFATLTGFDAIDSINGDDCERVIEQTLVNPPVGESHMMR